MFGNPRLCCLILVAACLLAQAAQADTPPENVVLPGSVPPSPVLQQISERQTELALLELAIKKAELEKRLQELRLPPQVSPESPPQQHIDGARPTESVFTPAPRSAAERSVSIAAGRYAVRRVHRVHGELVALIVLPGGDSKEVRKGTSLAGGILVSDVRFDGVFIRRGQEEPALLPAESFSAEER